MERGSIGVWSRSLRLGDPAAGRAAAGELEDLGYAAVWMPGAPAESFFAIASGLLEVTRSMTIASGILSVWASTPAELAAGYAAMEADHPGRFLLGLGVSHAHVVARQTGRTYARPMGTILEFLDGLDAASPPVPHDAIVLAALGPRMLELSARRSRGAHPYLVNAEHTRAARQTLGDGPLLAPEQAIVLERDPGRARALARQHLSTYLAAPNYVRNFRRLGFSDDDIAGDGSDRLVDAIVAWGDPATVVGRVREHHEAGADHVCVQVITEDPKALPLREWRTFGEAWFGG